MRLLVFLFVFMVAKTGYSFDIMISTALIESEKNDAEDNSIAKFGGRFAFGRMKRGKFFGDVFYETIERKDEDSGIKSKIKETTFGGGYIHYFKPLADSVTPFLLSGLHYFDRSGNGRSLKELQYLANLGMKFNLSKRVFFTLESELFNYALNSKDSISGESSTKTQIGIDSVGFLVDAELSLGVSF